MLICQEQNHLKDDTNRKVVVDLLWDQGRNKLFVDLFQRGVHTHRRTSLLAFARWIIYIFLLS